MKDRPYIKLDGLREEDVKPTMEKLRDIIKEQIGKPNTETNLAYLQSEIDNIFHGIRLFEVRRKYDTYKEKRKLWDSDEWVDVEKKVLNPHELELSFVGEYEDLEKYDLLELLGDDI